MGEKRRGKNRLTKERVLKLMNNPEDDFKPISPINSPVISIFQQNDNIFAFYSYLIPKPSYYSRSLFNKTMSSSRVRDFGLDTVGSVSGRGVEYAIFYEVRPGSILCFSSFGAYYWHFGELNVEVWVAMVWVLGGGAWLENGTGPHQLFRV